MPESEAVRVITVRVPDSVRAAAVALAAAEGISLNSAIVEGIKLLIQARKQAIKH